MTSHVQRGCNIDSTGTITLWNISVASSRSSCPSGSSMLDLGQRTTIYCSRGSWVPPLPLSLPPMNFTDCPYQCAAGRFGNTSHETDYTCTGECDGGGEYCPTGTAQPLPCPAGTYLPVGVAGLLEASCIPCAPGAYNPDEGGTRCLTCPAGKLSETVRSTKCHECMPGSYCPEGASAPRSCPRFAESDESSVSIEDCKCQKDYYDSRNSSSAAAADDFSCKPCPLGSKCKESGSTLALLPLRPGYWRTNDDSSDLRRCPDASSPDTTACANTNGALCKPFTTGPYCRVCNVTDGSRYFDSGQSACVECGDTAATSLAALVGITLAVLLLLCWCGWRQPCKRLRVMTYQALQKIRAPLKQMVAFYQVPRPLH